MLCLTESLICMLNTLPKSGSEYSLLDLYGNKTSNLFIRELLLLIHNTHLFSLISQVVKKCKNFKW